MSLMTLKYALFALAFKFYSLSLFVLFVWAGVRALLVFSSIVIITTLFFFCMYIVYMRARKLKYIFL